jgi:hypothetical protein
VTATATDIAALIMQAVSGRMWCFTPVVIATEFMLVDPSPRAITSRMIPEQMIARKTRSTGHKRARNEPVPTLRTQPTTAPALLRKC